jgi:hypothetical protein
MNKTPQRYSSVLVMIPATFRAVSVNSLIESQLFSRRDDARWNIDDAHAQNPRARKEMGVRRVRMRRIRNRGACTFAGHVLQADLENMRRIRMSAHICRASGGREADHVTRGAKKQMRDGVTFVAA